MTLTLTQIGEERLLKRHVGAGQGDDVVDTPSSCARGRSLTSDRGTSMNLMVLLYGYDVTPFHIILVDYSYIIWNFTRREFEFRIAFMWNTFA